MLKTDKQPDGIKLFLLYTVKSNSMTSKRDNTSLQEAGTQLPFTVPEGYFDELTGRITAQTSERHVPLRRMTRAWMYMAAMFAGIVLLGNIAYAIYQRNTNLKLENYDRYLMSQVDDVALIDFYLENFDE